MAKAGTVAVRGVTRSYAVGTRLLDALRGIDLEARAGEFVSIVGPSGCGKSTLLRLLAGLDTDYAGEILLDGAPISGTSLDRGLVFQDHRLLPWLTLEQNVAPPSDTLPDLAPIRALLYSEDYAAAATELARLAETTHHADVYNLLGFATRQLGRYDEAATWYEQALYFAPDHRPALEYQGELFLRTGALDRARENVKLLEIFCPEGCAELETLRAALAAAERGGR